MKRIINLLANNKFRIYIEILAITLICIALFSSTILALSDLEFIQKIIFGIIAVVVWGWTCYDSYKRAKKSGTGIITEKQKEEFIKMINENKK